MYSHPQIRNKLNQEQNSKLQQQKELLNKRNMEVTLMDKRISELRERLYKKKAEARQKENLPVRLEALNRLSPLFILLLLTKSLKWSVICKIVYFIFTPYWNQ